jgi:hypothetical protein
MLASEPMDGDNGRTNIISIAMIAALIAGRLANKQV